MFWRVRDILEELAKPLGLAGICTTEDQRKALNAYNRINEILMTSDDWPGTQATVNFTSRSGCITLPSQFGAITALRVEGVSTRILPVGWEFLEAGTGPITSNMDINVLQDLGNQHATIVDITPGHHVVAFSDQVESSANLRIYGYDSAGNELRFNGIPGTSIPIVKGEIEAQPYATPVPVSRISALIKTVTAGNVDVYGYDPAAQTMTWLTRLGQHETAPSYTRYMLPGIDQKTPRQVIASVNLNFRPLFALDDISLIQHREAYRLMARAIRAFDDEDVGKGAEYQNRAIKMLKSAIGKRTKGQCQTLNISMSRRPVRNGVFYSSRRYSA